MDLYHISNALCCACKNDNRTNKMILFPDLCTLQSSVSSIWSLFIFILSSCLRSEIISAVFCLLLLYVVLNALF